MKRTGTILILLAVFVLVPLFAQAADHKFGITPYAAYHLINDRFKEPPDSYGNAWEGGLRLEGYFDNRWSVELGLGKAEPKLQSTRVKESSTTFLLNAVYNLAGSGKIVPYLTAGIAGDSTDGKERSGPDAGIGARLYLTDWIMLRPEVRYIYLFRGREDMVATLGLTFAFGGGAPAARMEEPAPVPAPRPAPAPAPAPAAAPAADSDRDGVPDNADKCPNTPSGIKVDANGCPADADRDGVPDHLDKCPGSPANSKVDAEGCVLSVTLKVNFDSGQAVVKSRYLSEIEKFADFMKQDPSMKVEIQGHTDSLGNPQKNKALSEARAKAVREVLVDKYGIAADRLTAKGYGQDRPVTGNDTREGREMNRRVEAVIMK